MDVLDIKPIPLSSIPWIPPVYRPKSLNPILAYTLSVCDSIKYSVRQICPHLPLLPLLNCPLFAPGFMNPRSFQLWKYKGLTTVCTLLTASNTYETLMRSLIRNIFDIYKFTTLWGLICNITNTPYCPLPLRPDHSYYSGSDLLVIFLNIEQYGATNHYVLRQMDKKTLVLLQNQATGVRCGRPWLNFLVMFWLLKILSKLCHVGTLTS